MITISKQDNLVSISINADLINTSNQSVDLRALSIAIIEQLKAIYHKSVGKYSLDIFINFNLLKRVNQCSAARVLFQVVDTIPGNNPAEADFKGLRVKLNKASVNDMISNRNFRTLPHEVGHLLGLDHPHANAKYESINPDANPLEKQLTEEERKCNLMSQSWYAQRAGIPLERAVQLTEKQIEVLLQNYNNHQLNKNYHLKGFLFWKRIV